MNLIDRWLGMPDMAGLNWKGRAIERALMVGRHVRLTGPSIARLWRETAWALHRSAVTQKTRWAAARSRARTVPQPEVRTPGQSERRTRLPSPLQTPTRRADRPSTPPWMADCVERRILHLGNILNNGYLNAKFLRRRGWLADSVTVDYRHVQAQPEWEEVPIVDPKLPHFAPDWSRVDLAGYRRVPWFCDPTLDEIVSVAAWMSTAKQASDGAWEPPPAPAPARFRLRRPLERAAGVIAGAFSREALGIELIEQFAAVYPDRADQLTVHDVAEFRPRALAHGPLFDIYPLVQAYSLDPILPMLNNPQQPLICFEHGTMRDFPFEDSARGRLYALALKRAERVFITNADCNRSAERLGLTNYTFVPHPVDEQLYRPVPASPLGERLRREHRCDHIFLAPARHHWKHCPPSFENSWLKRNDILIRALGRLFAARPALRALVVFFEWGSEVDLSKQLIAECGFADRVRWEPIASKPVMREYYNAADIVFDQFNDGIGTFGTVVPESLASGKPVVLNYKEALHHWCFPELPPALNAASEDAIIAHTTRLLDDEPCRLALGARGRDWFLRNHSSTLVADRMIDVYLAIADRYGWKWRH
jgi:glycosyltransferase involved in cell wall biosynthesis